MTAIDISWKVYPNGIAYELLRHELADDIEAYATEQLRAAREENERLRAALKPFADRAEEMDRGADSIGKLVGGTGVFIDLGLLRKARAALNRPAAPAVGKGGGEKG